MKTCILRHGGYPNCARVAKEVRALLDEGVEVDLICLNDGSHPFFEKLGRLKLYRIPIKRRRGAITRYFLEYFVSFGMMTLLLSGLHAKFRYDCVQVNTMPDFLVFATFLPKLMGARIILDLHEPTPELWVTKFGRGRFRVLLRIQTYIEQLAIRYADQTLTVSECLRRRYAERGADISKIAAIPNTCDETKFSSAPSDSSLRQRTPEFVAVTHGTIEERYGHEVMIRAVHHLQGRMANFKLIIIGGGSYLDRIVALAQELQCDSRVSFYGYLPFDRLLAVLKSADVGLSTMYRTPYAELIDTNKMYEYIALRIPVISSRLPAIEENFDGRSLMYFEPGDHLGLAHCIMRLYQDPNLRHELVQNAYDRYETMRWNKSKHRYTSLVLPKAGASRRPMGQGQSTAVCGGTSVGREV